MSAFLIFVYVLGFYFAPSIIAVSRSHHDGLAIFILNMLLGWSLPGWVVALAWACTTVHPRRPDFTPVP